VPHQVPNTEVPPQKNKIPRHSSMQKKIFCLENIGFVQWTSAISGKNYGFVQWTSAFLDVSSNRGQTLKIALFYKKGTFGRKGVHPLRPTMKTPAWSGPIDSMNHSIHKPFI
jgi:hypothetical protein